MQANHLRINGLCYSDEKPKFKIYDYDLPMTEHIIFILPYNSLDNNQAMANKTLLELKKMIGVLNKYNKITAEYVMVRQDNQDTDPFNKLVINNKFLLHHVVVIAAS